MATSPKKRRLLTPILLAFGLFLAVESVTIATGLFYIYRQRQEALGRAAEDTARAVEGEVFDHLGDVSLRPPLTPRAQEDLEYFLGHLKRFLGVFRVKVFGPDGTILWSDEVRLIGKRYSHQRLREALKGEISFGSAELEEPEHLFEREVSHAVEVFIPIREEARGPVVAVVEAYRDVSPLMRQVKRGEVAVVVAALLSGGLLFLIPLVIMERAYRSQEALAAEARKTRDYLETLIDSTTDVVIASTDRDGKIALFNKGAEELLGWKVEEIVGQHVTVLYENEERARETMRLMRSSGGRVTGHETILRAKDGSLIPVLISASILYDEEGREVGTVGFNTDLRERKWAEEALRYSHDILEITNRSEELAPLLEEIVVKTQRFTRCAACGVRLLDEEGNIPYQAYKGFSKRFYDLESPLSLKSDQCMCIRVIQGEADPKLPYFSEGGSFYMNATTRFLATVSEEEKGPTRNVCNEFGYESVALVPLKLGEKILGLIHVADPSEGMVPLRKVVALEEAALQLATALQRIEAENRLREAHEELKKAYLNLERAQATAVASEKLAALGRLTAGVTHEILNPMNVITLRLHMMITDPEVSGKIKEDLKDMQEQANRIIRISRDLLYFARQRHPERAPVDVNAVLVRTLGLLEHDLRIKNIHVEKDLEEGLPQVDADQDQISQVIFNILTNARDIMPKGGRLYIASRQIEERGIKVVEIRIEDTGPGIPEEIMGKIFDPFFTTKPEGEGTGLGLSICQGIVEAHGGRIWAENLPQGGAAFIIRLPVEAG